MSDHEEEILFETAEEDIADFADQEEEETIEDTIVEQEEGENFAELDLEGTIEDSHPSELEDIIEEVNRVESRVGSTVLKPSAIESDSDSSSSSSDSDSESDFSDSDSGYDSDYYYKGMKNPDSGMGIAIKWDGDKATYDEFIHQYKDWYQLYSTSVKLIIYMN